jgi:6-phosphofructokinase 2
MGDILQHLLDREELDHQSVRIESWTRENFIALDESTGLQYRFGLPGPDITESEWRRFIDAVEQMRPPPEYLVASGSLPPGVPEDFYARLAETARSIDARYIVDTSGPALRRALEAGVYLLKPNLRELRQLTDQPLEHEREQKAAARQLIREGKSEVIILSLGAAGALLVTEDYAEHLRSPTVPIRSKVGAGDSMVGGIVAGLARGYDIRRAALYGISAGAAAVMSPGTELCRAEDVDQLFQQLTGTPSS